MIKRKEWRFHVQDYSRHPLNPRIFGESVHTSEHILIEIACKELNEYNPSFPRASWNKTSEEPLIWQDKHQGETQSIHDYL